ncbi:MAG: hypothetical protein IJ205_00830 [Bacteroidales bacterium]|nr:hypothetical protein [Bacteroidales bacterium]
MKNIIRICCAVWVFAAISCSSGKVMNNLCNIESFINDRPDSALNALRQIDTLTLRTKAEKAKYSLLHAMALDKNYIDTADTRIILPAVEYYGRHGSPEDRLKSMMYLGVEQYNAGLYNQAIVSFYQASEYAPKVEDQNLLGILYSRMADTYTMTRDYVQAEEYIDRFFLGQPKEGGGLRFSDYVATRSSNRAHYFNKTSESIWGLSCWQEDIVSKIGWKTEIGYPSTTYYRAICLETQPGTQTTDILSYELTGEYDVNYALKHIPSVDSDYGYVEPLLIADVHLVSSSLNTWLQNAIKDGNVDVSDILHANKTIQGEPINVNNNIYGCKATGVFGAESIIRFPIGSGQRDYAPPIELK